MNGDSSKVEGACFEEVAKLVQQRTIASKTLPYNWRYRRLEKGYVPGNTATGYLTKPLATFHMDNDRETAEMNLRKYLRDTEAERRLGKGWVSSIFGNLSVNRFCSGL